MGVNDVVLGSGNRMVSQLHFKIEFSEPGFAFISDTSTNGTLVNGKRISYGSKMALSSVAEIEVMDNCNQARGALISTTHTLTPVIRFLLLPRWKDAKY